MEETNGFDYAHCSARLGGAAVNNIQIQGTVSFCYSVGVKMYMVILTV